MRWVQDVRGSRGKDGHVGESNRRLVGTLRSCHQTWSRPRYKKNYNPLRKKNPRYPIPRPANRKSDNTTTERNPQHASSTHVLRLGIHVAVGMHVADGQHKIGGDCRGWNMVTAFIPLLLLSGTMLLQSALRVIALKLVADPTRLENSTDGSGGNFI